jgi:hypothetical protein
MVKNLNAYYGLDLPEGGDYTPDDGVAGIWLWSELWQDSLVVEPVAIKSENFVDVREYWREHATDPGWREFAGLIMTELVADQVRNGFAEIMEQNHDPDFRGVTEARDGLWSADNPEGIKARCLDRGDVQALELRVCLLPGHLEDDCEIDPCAVCCQQGQTVACFGEAQCPVVAP